MNTVSQQLCHLINRIILHQLSQQHHSTQPKPAKANSIVPLDSTVVIGTSMPLEPVEACDQTVTGEAVVFLLLDEFYP